MQAPVIDGNEDLIEILPMSRFGRVPAPLSKVSLIFACSGGEVQSLSVGHILAVSLVLSAGFREFQ